MKTQKLLIGLVLFLVVTNIATVITVICTVEYSTTSDQSIPLIVADTLDPSQPYRIDFFTNELGLSSNQQEEFMSVSQNYNWMARDISAEMSVLRQTQLDLMDQPEPDMIRLQEFSKAIGDKHVQLKEMTIEYYLGLKKICTREQQQKLYQVFSSFLNADDEVNPPRGRRYFGRGRRGRGNQGHEG